MVENNLYLDCGNTRSKYWSSDSDGIFESTAEFERFISVQQPTHAVIANVSNSSEDFIASCKRLNLNFTVVEVTDDFQGLKLVYSDISRLGVDRWLAMLACMESYAGQQVLVADVGTALTLDLIDGQKRHRGGIIAPGVRTMARSLVQNTAHLPMAEFQAVTSLGTDTQSCINHGVIMSSVALIEHTMIKFAGNAKLVLTGGDAALIAAHLAIDYHYEPDLILTGLKYFWRNK